MSLSLGLRAIEIQGQDHRDNGFFILNIAKQVIAYLGPLGFLKYIFT